MYVIVCKEVSYWATFISVLRTAMIYHIIFSSIRINFKRENSLKIQERVEESLKELKMGCQWFDFVLKEKK